MAANSRLERQYGIKNPSPKDLALKTEELEVRSQNPGEKKETIINIY